MNFFAHPRKLRVAMKVALSSSLRVQCSSALKNAEGNTPQRKLPRSKATTKFWISIWMKTAHYVRSTSPSDASAMRGTWNRLAFPSSPSPLSERCLPLPSGALSTTSQLCGLITVQSGPTSPHSRRSVNISLIPYGVLCMRSNTSTLSDMVTIPSSVSSVRRTITGTLT